MKKRLLLLVLQLVLIQALTEPSHAEGCSEPRSVCDEFWIGQDSIFLGRVINIAPLPKHLKGALRPARPDNLKPKMLVSFAVEKSYRKYREKQLEVEVLGSDGQSPFDFQLGSRYLVFAKRYLFSDARLSVPPCSRTKLVTQAQEDIVYLESVYRLNPAADVLKYRDEPVIHVSILQGKAIFLPRPAYPDLAKVAHASGAISVLILLDQTGKVIKVKSLCGHPLLMEAAEAAAWQARFSPTKVSGRPMKVSTIVIYNFVAQ